MNERTLTQQQKTTATMFTPVRSSVLQRKCACGQHTTAGGDCAECHKKGVGSSLMGARSLQRCAGTQAEPTTGPPIVHEVLRSPGQPLDPATRAYMESRFNHDFSQVRLRTSQIPQTGLRLGQPGDRYEQEADNVANAVTQKEDLSPAASMDPNAGDFSQIRIHTDAKAAEAARAMNARACTVGRDVMFAPGQYAPNTKTGQMLLAHELTHVVQKGGVIGAIQRKPDKKKGKAKTEILKRMASFLLNPAFEEGAIQVALQELNTTYSSKVKMDDIQYRVMTSETEERIIGRTAFGSACARSFWEKGVPVIEFAECALREFEQFESDPVANRHNGHNIIRMVAHEMYHLFRAKIKHAENPLQPLFEREYRRRMKEVRENWVRELGKERPGIKKWKDIPKAEREKIEREAGETSDFEGMYFETSYLVEEIYTKIEELSFLRIEQKLETGAEKETRAEVSALADMVGRMWNRLTGRAESRIHFLTPELLERTKRRMEVYIRNRYGKGTRDPYELRFFRTATEYGRPPMRSE